MATATAGASSLSTQDAAVTATKHKLKGMLEGLDQFEAEMKSGTRQRREKDEHRVAELKSDIQIVEQRVADEAKKRVEASHALQAWAAAQVLATRTRLEAQLAASQAAIQARLGELSGRIDALEAQFAADRASVTEDVRARNEELGASLRAFNEAFEAERRGRLEREKAILDRLTAEEHGSIARYEEERAAREQVYMAAKARLEEAVQERSKTDEKFQGSILEELAGVKNGLAAEEQAREAEDDEIAGTLNRYVQKLQASLALLHSDDTAFD